MMLFVALFLGCSETPPLLGTEPSVATVAAEFKDYRRMTKGTVFVNPEIAVQCRPVSKEQVEEARKKSGPHANAGIVIYMNDSAAKAFLTKSNAYPAGSVIVKEKQMLGSTDGKPVSNGVDIEQSAGLRC